MPDLLRVMQSHFRERVKAPRAWSLVAFSMSRSGLALLLGLLPGALLVLAVWLAPAELGKAATGHQNVQETFARLIGAVATASAIAVSVATVALRRELKGIRKQQERQETSEAYRGRVRRASGRSFAPISLGAFLATA